MSRSVRALAALAVAAVAACSSNPLSPATAENKVDTLTIFSLNGTGVPLPSAFVMEGTTTVRTDLSINFDFAYDIDSIGRSVLLPATMLKVAGTTGIVPGYIATSESFEDLQFAPINGYISTEAAVLEPGLAFYIRSRLICTNISAPIYGKFSVLSIDPLSRSVTLQVLVDLNCGYKGVTPGLPAG